MIRKSLNIVLSVFALLCTFASYANDTLSLEQYLAVVIENHPLIQKANINDSIAAAYLLKGKGALDPKLFSNYNQKQFDNKDYFTIWQSEAKIPTTLPIDFSVGYERNDGLFLNGENNVPNNGLVYATINLSLLKGLLFDQQRYELQSAEIKGLKSQIEREIFSREIIYQAISTYLEWAAQNNANVINQDYFQLVRQRHENIIQLFLNGDSPAIDTIESRLNLLSAEKLFLTSSNKLIKAKQKLSLFIWDEQQQPLQINSAIQPMGLEELVNFLSQLSSLDNPDFNLDPLIAKIDTEIEHLALDTRLERENLKPQLDLKYNTILNLGEQSIDPTFTLNDYKYGVTFLYPILNRKSKGQLKINESLTMQYELDKMQYRGQLNNKFAGLIAQQVIQEDLLQVINEKLTNSELLYEAEKLKFSIGESSVFLLNQRERKLLEASTDLVKNYHSLGKVFSELYYLKLGQI